MSDPIQMPPSAVAVARVAPVRPEPAIEPVKRPQTENRNSSEQRDERHSAPSDSRLSIAHDEKLKSFVYRSIDEDSGEVVWQWPAEEMLRRAHHLRALEEKQREEAHAVDEKV